MKGGVSVSVIMGTVFFAVAVGSIIVMQNAYYSDFAGFMKTPVENMEVVEGAHAFESCLARLSANERFISKDILEEYAGDSVNRICEIQEPIIWGYVKDMEDGKEYLFPPPEKSMVEKLFPPAMVDDFIEKIRRWENKKIKTEHMIWVPIAIPRMKKITDENFQLTGEFLIQARWEGLGSLKANDLILKLYPKDYYSGFADNVQTIQHHEVTQWLEDMKNKGIKFDSRIVNFYHIPVKDVIPHKLVDCDKMRVLDWLKSGTCVEVFENVSEIHMGRLGVKI